MVLLRQDGKGGLPAEPGNEQNQLVSLVQHFNVMQQHMFDQFQQTMVLLVRMLSSMHEQQVALIRDELRQFQKATEELIRNQWFDPV